MRDGGSTVAGEPRMTISGLDQATILWAPALQEGGLAGHSGILQDLVLVAYKMRPPSVSARTPIPNSTGRGRRWRFQSLVPR
jgi:hypothetical protein